MQCCPLSRENQWSRHIVDIEWKIGTLHRLKKKAPVYPWKSRYIKKMGLLTKNTYLQKYLFMHCTFRLFIFSVRIRDPKTSFSWNAAFEVRQIIDHLQHNINYYSQIFNKSTGAMEKTSKISCGMHFFAILLPIIQKYELLHWK